VAAAATVALLLAFVGLAALRLEAPHPAPVTAAAISTEESQ
jgi:hypothetical protein